MKNRKIKFFGNSRKLSGILNFLLIFITLISFTHAADLYQVFEPSFSAEVPTSIYVAGAECADNTCSRITSNNIELYNGDEFTICWDNLGENQNVDEFLTCVDNAKIEGNIIDTSEMSRIVIKENTDASFGYIKEFFASDDSYLPLNSRSSGYTCDYDICVDTNLAHLNFEKKSNAIAEIGQLNIKNIDNELLPVQVEVPVSIDETVCSAFRFVDSDVYRFQPPAGYSDYSADTLINLNIKDVETGVEYLDQSITIPIEADQCAGLAAFSWTPDTSLVNRDVEFKVTTDVIDNQVSSSITDWASVIETMYPENLTNSCWTRAYDFTLSNVPTFDLNTSIAQITEGESLYALFSAGAYRDETLTPINFEAILSFNGTVVYQELESSTNDLSDYVIDLSNSINGLSEGSYEVTLLTRPIDSECSIAEPVIQTQNLQILAPDLSYANFYVKDGNGNYVDGANINLELLNVDDYYQEIPTYEENQVTNSNGYAVFNDLIAGEYKYTVTKDGFTSVTNEIHIASNMDVYITLPSSNSAPVINLPDSVTADYNEVITLDLRNYISDFNDDFDDLTITYSLVSGNVVINRVGDSLELSTNQPNVGSIEVFVQDPSGERVSDTMQVVFVDNKAPVVNQFYAEPDNGEEPFNTHFIIEVSDEDNDSLTCNIDFGDGTSLSQSCDSLNGIAHTYNLVGSYNAVLEVLDGVNEPVESDEWVFVFNRTIDAPIINDFTITTSNGYIIPTDITLAWDITHPKNDTMDCTLRINGENNDVPCIGEYSIDNFNITGVSRFTIIAIDSNGTQVLRTLERTFYEDEVALTNLNTQLIVSDEIVPGEFNFAIETNDEILDSREIKVKPIIECMGVDNTLDNGNGILSTSAISSVNSDVNTFNFKTNTEDFKLLVPTNVQCNFKVELIDEFGTSLELSKSVVFKYPEAEHRIQSIRGKTIDVMNYMTSALAKEMNVGYNSLEFMVENNDYDEKTLVISVSIQGLNIINNQEINLGPGQERTIQIPLFIKEGTEPGLYPLRFSVYDGDDKQVRYSYLNVK